MIMAKNQAESTKNFTSYTMATNSEGLLSRCTNTSVMHILGILYCDTKDSPLWSVIRTKRHCSSQFREYVATNYRPKSPSASSRAELVSIADIVYFYTAYKPVQCSSDSEWLCIGTKIKSYPVHLRLFENLWQQESVL